MSEEQLSEIDRRWDEDKINLLHSPPASGKTTFSERFGFYSQSQGYQVRRISMIKVKRMKALADIDSFNAIWKEDPGQTAQHSPN